MSPSGEEFEVREWFIFMNFHGNAEAGPFVALQGLVQPSGEHGGMFFDVAPKVRAQQQSLAHASGERVVVAAEDAAHDY